MNRLLRIVVLIFYNFTVDVAFVHMLLLEITLLKNQDEEHTHRDSRIGNIEYGAKKEKVIVTPYGDPTRERALDEGSVEHIYDFPM